MNKLVSVIIPTYKRSDFLLRTIDSVLNQTYSNIEIIVVDDNGVSTEFQETTQTRLQPLIDKGDILYIPHEVNKNGSAARNTGFRMSHGEYINFMDDDDTFEPQKIEKQVAILEQQSELGACYCNTTLKVNNKKDKIVVNNMEGNILSEVLSGKARFNTTTILFRRTVIASLNGFDESFLRHQDWELLVRFFRHYTIGIVFGEPLINKYCTPNIVSRNPLRAIEFKEKFLLTFKADIDSLSDSADIYKFQFQRLGHDLIGAKFRKEGLKYVFKANSYKALSLHDWFIIIRSYIYSFIK